MASRSITVFVDDFTGETLASADHRRIAFAFQGKEYLIDLSCENAEEFTAVMRRYIAVASSPTRKPAPRPRSGHAELQRVRHWARDNGYPVKPRGRISDEVLDAYVAANPRSDG